MRFVKTKQECKAVVAVELFNQAVDGMQVYFDQTRGIFPLKPGDIEIEEATTHDGRTYYRIDGTVQLYKRLREEYGLREPGYDHFEYMTREQVETRKAEIEAKLNNINMTLATVTTTLEQLV